MKPPISGNEIPINYSSPLYRRRLEDLDSDGFKKFNIYLDFENLKEGIKIYKLEKHQNTIISCLKKASNTLMSLLKVKPLPNDYWLSDSNLKECDINYWEKEKFGDEAHNKDISLLSLGIDLLIFSKLETFEYFLASAGPIYVDSQNRQPYIGKININNQIDFSKKGIEEYLTSALVHEMTHILGFSSYYFDYFKFNFNQKDKYGLNRFYLKSPNVLKVAKKYFNCSDIDGVELENDGGGGTAASHWESRILLGENMCGYLRTEEQVISEFTLAYLEDTGYYKPNYYTGGLMRYGKNKGCSFLTDKCINNYEIKPEFENEFFDTIYYQYDPSCSSGRLGRAYNFLSSFNDLPIDYQYFKDQSLGGVASVDYCPVPQQISNEKKLNYFSGSCSELGTYGSLIYYDEEWDEGNTHYKGTRHYNNSYLEKITGEKYSNHSFCYLSSLVKKSEEKSDVYSKKTRAICFESFCSSKSLTVKVHENYIVCPRAGGKIVLDEYGGYLLCPDYNLICTGTILCNNMFNCVDKKSELKNDAYNYDYKIKTSQNIEDADIKEADNKTNYELSEDGQCPSNCKQCLENKKCIKCREDFEFVGTKNEEKITCIHKDEVKRGYYKSGSLYYKCIDNCEKCTSDKSCDKCETNYINVNNFCQINQSQSDIIQTDFNESNKDISDIIQTDYNESSKDLTDKIQTDFYEPSINKITIIILLQALLKNDKLFLYLLIDSYIPKNFSLATKIDKYTQKSLRNLQEETKEEEEIIISLINCSSNVGYEGLCLFSPEKEYKQIKRIVVKDFTLNKNNNQEENKYILKLVNNSDYLDTSKMEEMLNNNQAVDLSQIKTINIYHLDSVSKGCTFNLTTKETIRVKDRELDLEFQEINTHQNKSTICSLYENKNTIKCNLDEIIDSNYTLNDYIDYSNNELLSIISDKQNSFPLNCFFKYNRNIQNKKSSGISKTGIVFIIIAPIIAILIFISLFYIINYHNKKPNQDNIVPTSSTVEINK